MKKSLLVIALVLLSLFFVSCNKESADKSEEMVARYEKFCETYMMMSSTTGLFPKETKTALSGVAISADNMKAFLSAYNSGKNIDITTSGELNFTGGSITVDNSSAKKKTAKVDPDAIFTVSYTVGTVAKENQKYTIKMSSSYEEGDKETSVSFSLTINDKVYSTITYKFNNDEKFTSAFVDGEEVSVRLLNASHLNPSLYSSEKAAEETTETNSSSN